VLDVCCGEADRDFFAACLLTARSEDEECLVECQFFRLGKIDRNSNPILSTWDSADPLANVFEACVGGYPDKAETGQDYAGLFVDYFRSSLPIKLGGPVNEQLIRHPNPHNLTSFRLSLDLRARYHSPALFLADAKCFADLVYFWNVRASNVPLFFIDLVHYDRFRQLIEHFETKSKASDRRLAVWKSTSATNEQAAAFADHFAVYEADVSGESIDSAPAFNLLEQSLIAHVYDNGRRPSVTIPILHKPGIQEFPLNTQDAVLIVKRGASIHDEDRFVFSVPNIPEMNHYFGRHHYFDFSRTRATKDGLGVITDVHSDHLTLNGMERFEFVRALFGAFDILCEISQAGLVCDQLIRQLGGLQGCRVFKIKGVRALLEQFTPTQTFKKTFGITTIGDNDKNTGRPNFAEFENLHLEPRKQGNLKPEDAFAYLLKKGVLRVGLEFKCTLCALTFWREIDDLGSLVKCEYCGGTFNVTTQLKDRDWAYRPSGLFGRGDHQEGGVPVALTLQQIDTMLTHSMLWFPAMKFESKTAPIESCESDFVIVNQRDDGRVELVFGECKTNQEITEEDVRKLSKLADAFPPQRFDTFIIFSKTGIFSLEEVQRCAKANRGHRKRTILLSARELEPHFVYDRAVKEFEIDRHGVSLEDLVRGSEDIYFQPRPRILRDKK
jgi:hypothetical protein